MASSEADTINRASELLARLEALVECFESAAAARSPEFVTVADAARHLGIGEKALRGAVSRGEVRVFRLGTESGGRPRVRIDEVREWGLSTIFDPSDGARRAGELAARQAGREPTRRRITNK